MLAQGWGVLLCPGAFNLSAVRRQRDPSRVTNCVACHAAGISLPLRFQEGYCVFKACPLARCVN